MSNNNDRKVIAVPESSHIVAKYVTEYLSKCFPKKDPSFIEGDLLQKKYDMFYLVDSEKTVLGILAAKPDPARNEVYITHVCKTTPRAGKGIFARLYEGVKERYGENVRYHLKVRGNNQIAIRAYKKQDFRKRLNHGFKLTDDSYYIVMNSTKVSDAFKIAQDFRVGQSVRETGLDIVTLRRALLDVTIQRWVNHKLKWQRSKGTKDSHMHMIYGNLAITMFIAINQYLSTGVHESQVFSGKEKLTEKVSTEFLKRAGANYLTNQTGSGRHVKNNTTQFTTLDLFKAGVFNKSFKDLKKLARERFDIMYRPVKKELKKIKKSELSAKTIMNAINRTFKGRSQNEGLDFYGHNMGMYQYLAMFGHKDRELLPYTGNCTMIALFRLAFYDKFVGNLNMSLSFQRELKTQIELLSQAKYVQNTGHEICHYGVRAKDMSIRERYNGGNFQRQTYEPFGYLETASAIDDFTRMYDVLTANAMYRAKHRAGRNQGNNLTRGEAMYELTNRLSRYMDAETLALHGHRLSSRITYRVPENL